MEIGELDERMEEISKTIFSYCLSRTPNIFEAEDLAQEILLELCRSVPNLKKRDAFYAFMWRIAGNCYKQWCRKRALYRECTLSEETATSEEIFHETEESLQLLRRELTLLSEKYRTAVILYYLEKHSCSQIARSFLSVKVW